jgi:nucleoid-associated protein YgaU
MFFKGSRYERVPEAQFTGADGRVVRYKLTRFISPSTTQTLHTVGAGERLDQIAHRHFRDPERFWRIADANAALDPQALTAEPGRVLRVPPADD